MAATTTASIVFYAAVNTLFVAKYALRLSPRLWPLVIVAACFYAALPFLLSRIVGRRRWQVPLLIAAAVVLAAYIAIQYSVDPYSLQVDRWSALHFPIQNLLRGQYPYMAQTHLGGYASPFPVWLVLHIPFYLVGNVALSVFPVMLFFFWTIYHRQGMKAMLMVVWLTFPSICVGYEIVVRSDLITNMLLSAAILNLVFPYVDASFIRRHWLLFAVGMALMTCTRLIAVLPFMLLVATYVVAIGWRRLTFMSIVFFAVVALAFAGIVALDAENFLHFSYAPYVLQTRQGNMTDFIVFIPLFVWLAYRYNIRAKSHSSILYLQPLFCFSCMLLLTTIVLVTFLHNMITSSNFDLFSSQFDITYFTTSLPFCLLLIGCRTSTYE